MAAVEREDPAIHHGRREAFIIQLEVFPLNKKKKKKTDVQHNEHWIEEQENNACSSQCLEFIAEGVESAQYIKQTETKAPYEENDL